MFKGLGITIQNLYVQLTNSWGQLRSGKYMFKGLGITIQILILSATKSVGSDQGNISHSKKRYKKDTTLKYKKGTRKIALFHVNLEQKDTRKIWRNTKKIW